MYKADYTFRSGQYNLPTRLPAAHGIPYIVGAASRSVVDEGYQGGMKEKSRSF